MTNATDGEAWYGRRDSFWESLSCSESRHIHATTVFGEPGWYTTDQPPQEQQAVICAGAPYYSSSITVVLCIAASSVYMSISTQHTSMSI
jgi:hypothetical protein